MQSSQQNQLPDYISLNNTAFTYLNSTNSEGQNVIVGNMPESSSIAAQNLLHHSGQNSELVWASSMIGSSSGVGPVRQNEPANVFPVNAVSYSNNQIANGPMFVQSSAVSQDFNINAGYGEQGSDDCQIVERPNIFKSSSSENARLPLPSGSSSSNPYGLHLSGYEDRDGRPGNSSAGRRLSRKRKAMEGDIGQSSGSGVSNYFQHAEGSAWHAARSNANNSLSISLPSENASGISQLGQLNQGFGMSVGGIPSDMPPVVTATRSSESSRNLRLRFSSSHQLDSSPANVFAAGTAVAPVNYLSPHQPPRNTPVNGPLDLLSPTVTDGGIMRSQSPLAYVPAMHRNQQSSRWNRNSSSRPGSSSSIAIAGDNRVVASHDEARSRSMQRNILEHPMFIPSGMRDATHSQSPWGLTSGNNNVVPPPHSGSSAGANPTSAPPNAVRIRNSPQYSRRLSELVRRSLLASSGIQHGGHITNALPGAPASTQGMTIPSWDQGNHLPPSGSANLPNRRNDGAFGIPYSLRTLAAATATEGRSRLVSEVCS